MPALLLLLALPVVRAQGTTSAESNTPQIPTFRVGLKTIAIPSPASELTETGPDYRVLFETFSPSVNRLVAAFVLPAEVDALRNHSSEDVSTYALVEVPRALEFREISPDTYKVLADAVAKEFGTKLDADVKTGIDELNQRLKDLNSNTTLSVDKPTQLGTLFSESDAVGFGLLMQGSANGRTTQMAMVVVLVRVRDRVIYGYLYKQYKDADTVRWLSTAGHTWADAVLKANQ